MKYTEGICGDGAAILRNGERMTIGEVVNALNDYAALEAKYNALFEYEASLLGMIGSLEAKYAALKDAARPVVEACYAADVDGELDERIDGQMLFKLAALVGEENSEAKG